MKIYLLPVKEQKLPKINPFMGHSKGFNIETGFVSYLYGSNLLTKNPREADWHYLPIYWSYFQLGNNYGMENRDKMQAELDHIILDDRKTFTISEADNEPGFEIGQTTVFSGNQSVGYFGHKWIPAPIITLPHVVPTVLPEKRYLSNFVGHTGTWATRINMVNLLKDRSDVKIINSKKGEELFVNTILESYSTLCPRGSAMSSYRFYESLQLGVAPIMIAEEDFRPFKNKIDWDSCSYFTNDVFKLPEILELGKERGFVEKGKKAKEVWSDLFNNWPEYILDTLKSYDEYR